MEGLLTAIIFYLGQFGPKTSTGDQEYYELYFKTEKDESSRDVRIFRWWASQKLPALKVSQIISSV